MNIIEVGNNPRKMVGFFFTHLFAYTFRKSKFIFLFFSYIGILQHNDMQDSSSKSDQNNSNVMNDLKNVSIKTNLLLSIHFFFFLFFLKTSKTYKKISVYLKQFWWLTASWVLSLLLTNLANVCCYAVFMLRSWTEPNRA